MKQFYKIHEISKLYHIGADSLRYYERLGILDPVRGENGYRLYSLKDIYKLNIIRDLRQLDFSMQQIKSFLDDQSVDNTLDLIQDELDLIDKRVAILQGAKKILQARKSELARLLTVEDSVIQVLELPERRCIQLCTEITSDEEADFALKKLHRKNEGMLQKLADQELGCVPIMASMAEARDKHTCGSYSSVFFILNEKASRYDFVLPAGRYLSVFYRGDYTGTPRMLAELRRYADDHGLVPTGEPVELCRIDNRHTVRPEEYLTELQVRIKEEPPAPRP